MRTASNESEPESVADIKHEDPLFDAPLENPLSGTLRTPLSGTRLRGEPGEVP
jgi:hypothetical protein